MSRRPGRSRRPVTPPLTLAQRFAALFQGAGAARDVWFDASRYTGLVTAPTAFVDYADPTHTLAVTGTLPVTADAAMGNALAASFSATQRGVSNRSGSDWSFLNNTPGHQFLVLKPANTTFAIWAETGLGGTTNAVNIISNTNIQTILARDVGTQALIGPAVAANTPLVIEVYYDDTGTPARYLKVLGQVAVTGATIANNDGACTSPLSIGDRATGGFGMTGTWRSYYAFHRILNASERATVYAKILAETSIAA